MSFTKLSQQVRLDTGEVATLAEFLDSDRAFVAVSEKFHAPRAVKGYVTAYFVDLVEDKLEGRSSGWRIGQRAYESRVDRHNWNAVKARLDKRREQVEAEHESLPEVVVKDVLDPFGAAAQIRSEKMQHGGTWYSANVYRNGELIYAGDELYADPEHAVQMMEKEFTIWASEAAD